MKKEPNTFVRILLVLFIVALWVLVFTSFWLGEPKYQITGGLITVLGLITILVLSESFNHLSLGKILTLTKEVENKETENKKLYGENTELRNNLMSLVSNVQQSQVTNTFNAPPEAWLKLLGVVQAGEESEAEQQEEQQEAQQALEAVAERDKARDVSRQRMKLRRSAESAGLKKFISNLSIPESEFIYRAEFSSAFEGIDPVMNRRVVFDGYIKGTDIERFVEIRHRNMASPMFMDRLYLMLTKIYLYKQAKNIQAELILILINTPDEDEDVRRPWKYEQLLENFQPAIANNLLRIEHIDITEEEAILENEGEQQNLL